ncbi:MAG: TIGR00159 family protein [Lachnospiraceae bacterium]|jgi:diadenylate cyclase|nr:TIGR00159 family protein [Lachnospiraceae bacterium]
MDILRNFFSKYLQMSSLPDIRAVDVLEVFILSCLLYQILRWIKETRAWVPVKGIVVLALFIMVAYFMQMHTIIWLVEQLTQVGLIGVVILFQPELRRSLEELGRRRMIPLFSSDNRNKRSDDRFTEKTVGELVKACFEMGKMKTGALLVIEQDTPLNEYERTGIRVDGIITSQLLLNIFEKNTPLHDGAVIIRGNRVTAATCYLPLSDNMGISKDLGTRHRAGLGISEVTDSVTIIVSEETGAVSLAHKGHLMRNVSSEDLKAELQKLKEDVEVNRGLGYKLWKGLQRNEGKADK